MQNERRVYLTKLRKKRKLSQSEVAELLGFNRSTYASWENGTRTPKLDEMEKISSFFGEKDFPKLFSKGGVAIATNKSKKG